MARADLRSRDGARSGDYLAYRTQVQTQQQTHRSFQPSLPPTAHDASRYWYSGISIKRQEYDMMAPAPLPHRKKKKKRGRGKARYKDGALAGGEGGRNGDGKRG